MRGTLPRRRKRRTKKSRKYDYDGFVVGVCLSCILCLVIDLVALLHVTEYTKLWPSVLCLLQDQRDCTDV